MEVWAGMREDITTRSFQPSFEPIIPVSHICFWILVCPQVIRNKLAFISPVRFPVRTTLMKTKLGMECFIVVNEL